MLMQNIWQIPGEHKFNFNILGGGRGKGAAAVETFMIWVLLEELEGRESSVLLMDCCVHASMKGSRVLGSVLKFKGD